VIQPANNIIGITHHVSLAPPVKITSITFIEISMEIMEIRDIPAAVLRACNIRICFDKMAVSRSIEVIKPLTIARLIMTTVGQANPEI